MSCDSINRQQARKQAKHPNKRNKFITKTESNTRNQPLSLSHYKQNKPNSKHLKHVSNSHKKQ